jgi:hypothetical protein
MKFFKLIIKGMINMQDQQVIQGYNNFRNFINFSIIKQTLIIIIDLLLSHKKMNVI